MLCSSRTAATVFVTPKSTARTHVPGGIKIPPPNGKLAPGHLVRQHLKQVPGHRHSRERHLMRISTYLSTLERSPQDLDPLYILAPHIEKIGHSRRQP